MAETLPTTFRLSLEAREQIELLRDHYATLSPARPSAADVIEEALSRLAAALLHPGPAKTSGKSRKT